MRWWDAEPAKSAVHMGGSSTERGGGGTSFPITSSELIKSYASVQKLWARRAYLVT